MINEWNNRQKAIADVISLIRNNGYYPCIVDDTSAFTRILPMCKHHKIANFGHNIIDIQRKGKKRWEWDKSPEYWCPVSGDFIDNFCEYCTNDRYGEKKKYGVNDEMTGTIWIYDDKKAEKCVKEQRELIIKTQTTCRNK